MSAKTLGGWVAVAFVVWWVIEQPANAAHLVHNIGAFLSTSAHGLSGFVNNPNSDGLWVTLGIFGGLAVLITALIITDRFRTKNKN